MTNFSKPVDLLKRREFLRSGTMGIGSLALSHLLQDDLRASSFAKATEDESSTQHAPKAKRVIFLHMVGGPSADGHLRPQTRTRQMGRKKPTGRTDPRTEIRFHHP